MLQIATRKSFSILHCLILAISCNVINADKMFLYVGTYTKDIYIFEAIGNQWSPRGTAGSVGNPSFLVKNVAGDRLYTVNELDDVEGAVSAYIIDSQSGLLTLLNSRLSGGRGPAHLAIDPITGRNLVVANYGTGNLVTLSIGKQDGSIGDIVHSVESDVPNAKAHQVTFDPQNRYTLGVFLGLDEIRFYELNVNSGDLRPVEVSRRDGRPNRRLNVRVPTGSGPRHLVYNPNGSHFYVVNELDSTICVFASNSSISGFQMIQHISSLPGDIGKSKNNSSYAGEIAIHPTGKYMYVTNRGHDSIAVFAVNRDRGTLRPIQFVPSGGSYPRHLLLDSQGVMAFVSNQNENVNGVQLFDVDSKTGLMKPRQKLNVPKAVCALLVTTS